MRPCIFIHTNEKQIVGALVSKYSFERFAKDPNALDVKLIHTKDYPFLATYEGRTYLRDGVKRQWRNDDLQSFTLLRFMPPELMNYEGRSVVVDPDVFAVADVTPLLTRDLKDKAILVRKEGNRDAYASSVMVLDNAKLRHWQVKKNFDEMFEFKRDYVDWTRLRLEPEGSIGRLEDHWNDFDRLTPETRLVHNTYRRTQPWKTGLKVDFRPQERAGLFTLSTIFQRARRALFGDYGLLGRYKPHPDRTQERLFFSLLRECVEKGIVTEEMLGEQMRLNHVRHDAFEVLARTPTLREQPLFGS